MVYHKANLKSEILEFSEKQKYYEKGKLILKGIFLLVVRFYYLKTRFCEMQLTKNNKISAFNHML